MTKTASVVIIPCTGAKLTSTAPAAELYTGTTFGPALKAARRLAGQDGTVLILSAKHGLLHLDAEVEPYNVKMGDAEAIDRTGIGTVAAQLAELAPTTITTLLPKAYLAVIEAAAGTAKVVNLYKGCRGIGDQRGVCRRIGAGL